jgi:hypothetical protein
MQEKWQSQAKGQEMARKSLKSTQKAQKGKKAKK